MRSVTETQACWTFLEQQTSLEDLRALASSPAPSSASPPFIRSQLWKIFLLFETLDRDSWPAKLRSSRDAYSSLRAHFLRGVEHPDELDSAADPLSEDTHSPWIALRNDEALRQEILLDVDRCMPDNYYFRQPESQRLLLDILFLWSKLNMDVGYRQGMHEVLAPVLWVVERDAIDPSTLVAHPSDTGGKSDADDGSSAAMMQEMLDARFIGHDTFTLFSLIMQHAKSSYEHVAPSSRGKTQNPAMADTPMITRSKRIMEDYLAKVDPQLSNHIQDIDIVPQVFLIRWIRLLFGREFPFDQVLQLWDGLFAARNTLECIDLVCVAMLLRIRWKLMVSDYNTALGLLVNYPELSPDSGALTLLDDALYLRENLSREGGNLIVQKRSGRCISLDGNIHKPDQDVASMEGHQNVRKRPALNPTGQVLPQFVGFEALLQDAARGMYTRGEKWGLNKAMRDAVGEVRKNMQGLHSRTHSRTHSLEQTPEEKAQQKMQTLQARNKTLARMLESAVSDLWQQQSTMAQEKSDNDPHVKALTVATAKVQLVQAYLNDSTIPLPSEDGLPVTGGGGPEQGRTGSPSVKPQPATAKPVQRKPGRKDSGGSMLNQEKETTSTEQRQKLAPALLLPQPDESSPGPESTVSPPSQPAAEQQQPATPERPSTRRHLAQSDFSWMLGQQSPNSLNTPRSTFVSASPFFMPADTVAAAATQPAAAAGKRTKAAAASSSRGPNSFLFGEEEEEDDGASVGTAATSKGRGRDDHQGPRRKRKDNNDDLFGISMKDLEDRK